MAAAPRSSKVTQQALFSRLSISASSDAGAPCTMVGAGLDGAALTGAGLARAAGVLGAAVCALAVANGDARRSWVTACATATMVSGAVVSTTGDAAGCAVSTVCAGVWGRGEHLDVRRAWARDRRGVRLGVGGGLDGRFVQHAAHRLGLRHLVGQLVVCGILHPASAGKLQLQGLLRREADPRDHLGQIGPMSPADRRRTSISSTR